MPRVLDLPDACCFDRRIRRRRRPQVSLFDRFYQTKTARMLFWGEPLLERYALAAFLLAIKWIGKPIIDDLVISSTKAMLATIMHHQDIRIGHLDKGNTLPRPSELNSAEFVILDALEWKVRHHAHHSCA